MDTVTNPARLMVEIQAPGEIPDTPFPKVFLAGSIEMGLADGWQGRVARRLEQESVMLLNPRRDDWDSSWKQDKDDANFRRQVEWELSALEASDYIIFYFDPATKSPISLLELGLFGRDKETFVVCPEGFWRKGNVDIVCAKFGIPEFLSLDDLLEHLIPLLRKFEKRN